MSLMFIFTALVGLSIGLGAYLIPMVRDVEDLLPDHEAEIAEEVAEGAKAAAEAAPA
jgi:hypothetical protein